MSQYNFVSDLDRMQNLETHKKSLRNAKLVPYNLNLRRSTGRLDDALVGNNGDASAGPIVFQCEKHLSAEFVGDGLDGRVDEEIEEIPLAWVVSIELSSDTQDVFELSKIAGRYDTPPFICDLAGSENDGDAPGVIVLYLLLEYKLVTGGKLVLKNGGRTL